MAIASVWKYPQYFQVILHRYSNLPNLSTTNHHELCRPRHLAIRNFITINVKRRRVKTKTKATVLPGLPGAPSSSASSQFAFHHHHHIIPLSAVSYQSAKPESKVPIIFLRHHINPRTYSNCHTCDVQISKSTIPTTTTSTTDLSVTKNAFSQFSSKKLFPTSNSISFQVPNHHSVFLLSRRLFCSGDGAAGGSFSSSSSSTSTTPISISFIDGYFKLYLDSIEFIFHYWSSIEMVRHSLQQHFEQQSNLNKISNLYFEHEVADIDGSTGTQREQQQQYYRLSESMPFGYMFKVLDPSRIRLVQIGDESIENGKIYRKFSFGSTSLTDEEDKMRKLCLARIDDWSRENPIPPSGNSTKQSSYQSGSSFDSHELLFLEHERQSLLARFTPLERDFNKMVKTAKTEAHLRFKWGGLFLLSAQMGFVARLTWFEYSWDIMEPVTWFLTYVMMVGTFAYYLVTSQEYLVPMVEKRIILARFWKLVRSTNFDVLQYRTLRDELGQVEMKIQRIRDSLGVTNGPSNSNSSSTYPYNTIQARPLGDKEHL